MDVVADLRTFAVSKQMERPLMSSRSRVETSMLENIVRMTVILSGEVIEDITGECGDWKWRT